MHPAREYAEVTPYSVITGIILAVIFSAAAAYLGLRVGQVFEAAIPIAIIAVGLSGALKKNNPLGQNVIIQSIGACSGVIVAGAIFTLPALFILQSTYNDITVNFLEIFLSSLFGGVLGILFFIPFRKYFVKDMHGKYPFPEATATTQVLVSAQAKNATDGGQAKTLVIASLVGGIYDYIVATFGFWAETVTSEVTGWGAALAEKTKLVFSCNTGAALLGLGYIVGIKYAFCNFRRLCICMVDYNTAYRHLRLCRDFCNGFFRNILQLRSSYRHRWHSDGRNHRHSKVMGHHNAGCRSCRTGN